MRIKKRGEYHKLISGEEDNSLVIAASGFGKGLLGERIKQEYHKKGWVIITLPSPKLNLEFGYACFKPKKSYHLKRLKFQREEPKSFPIKLYHFYTTNFPKTKLPEFEILTMSIKRFNRLLNYFQFEESAETESLRILLNSINQLKNNEGISQLINIAETKGTLATTKKIKRAFDRFFYSPLIFPHDCPYNLDMKNILKDQKHQHVFSSRYINDIKTRDLINLYILLEIIRVKQEKQDSPPVCIFMDEIKSLCPNSPVYDFKRPLNKIISEILSICRGLGINIISNTQIYAEVAGEVRGAFNTVILGKMSDLKDLSEIAQVIKMDSFTRQSILTLNYNEFFVLNTGEGINEGEFLTFLPQHMHCERGYSFDKMFATYYPEKMKKHSVELTHIQSLWKNSLS